MKKPRKRWHATGAELQPSFRQIAASTSILVKAPNDGKLSMSNVLAADEQQTALQMLVEGNSLRSVTRLTGVHRTTVMNLLARFGDACRQFMDEEMRGLKLDHLEVDEVWTFVAKKQARLHVQERDNPNIGDMYMWVALDQTTKLVPTFIIGKR